MTDDTTDDWTPTSEAPPDLGGRPTDYCEELASHICDRIACGESLRSICTDAGMPDKATVFRWLPRHDDFRRAYALAREAQADCLADEVIEIADDARRDFTVTDNDGDEPSIRVDHEHIARSRLRCDSRKWFASKVAPKKYGERVTQEMTGPNGAPLSATILLTGGPEPSPASETVDRVPDDGD